MLNICFFPDGEEEEEDDDNDSDNEAGNVSSDEDEKEIIIATDSESQEGKNEKCQLQGFRCYGMPKKVKKFTVNWKSH